MYKLYLALFALSFIFLVFFFSDLLFEFIVNPLISLLKIIINPVAERLSGRLLL